MTAACYLLNGSRTGSCRTKAGKLSHRELIPLPTAPLTLRLLTWQRIRRQCLICLTMKPSKTGCMKPAASARPALSRIIKTWAKTLKT